MAAGTTEETGQHYVFAKSVKDISVISLRTCSLRPHQRGAGCTVVQGDDLHGVFGSRTQAVDDGRLSVTAGGRVELSLAFFRVGVQNPVGCDDSFRTVPGDTEGGGVDLREAQVFGPVHILNQGEIQVKEELRLEDEGILIGEKPNDQRWYGHPNLRTNHSLVKALTTIGELSPSCPSAYTLKTYSAVGIRPEKVISVWSGKQVTLIKEEY